MTAYSHELKDELLTGKCSLCGGFTSAFEVAKRMNFEICSKCARDVLPKLIADSLGQASRPAAEFCFEQLQSAFWRSVAINCLRSIEQAERDRDDGDC